MNKDATPSEILIVLTTEKDYMNAENLARLLLDSNLAACISFLDAQSFYLWEGKIKKSKEVQLIVKTTSNNIESLLSLIKKEHSYKIPELLFWQVSSEKDYMSWIQDVLK